MRSGWWRRLGMDTRGWLTVGVWRGRARCFCKEVQDKGVQLQRAQGAKQPGGVLRLMLALRLYTNPPVLLPAVLAVPVPVVVAPQVCC